VTASRSAPTFVLVHSPLVGPSTLLPVARELKRRRRHVAVPSLLDTAAAPPPQWQRCVEVLHAATSGLSRPLVLVGHSGGGLLLPAISGAVGDEVAQLIFLDSGVPAITGETPLAGPAFLDFLRTLAVDGTLPPWSKWWGEEAMRELIPDEATRTAVERELPSLPLSYFEQSVPSPGGWERIPAAFVLLSEAYVQAASEARARGWPVAEITGAQHLHTVVAPAEVAQHLLRLTA
jgi:pimeloyl-ACP methyl ester carboxylesterase